MFVPGSSQRFLDKAAGTAADGLFLDLEDGVLPPEKAGARKLIADTLGKPWGGPIRYVRVNAISTPWLVDDLDMVVRPGLDGICLTKVDRPDDVLEVARMIDRHETARSMPPGSVRMVAAIESAMGLVNAPRIAACHPRMAGLMFGAEDFALDIGLSTKREKEAAELIYARSAIVVAAAAAKVASIDGVYPNLDDPEGLVADTYQARRLGFSAKSTFNPRQIETINAIFSPQPEEIAYARRIANSFREAEARGEASVAVGGQLVDRPILLRALQILAAVDGKGAA